MDRRTSIKVALAVAVLGLLFVPSAAAETLEDVLKSYIGQKRILRHAPDKGGWRVKWKNLQRLKGGFDAAVEVLQAAYQGNEVRFKLDLLGTALLPEAASGRKKVSVLAWGPTELRLVGLTSEISADVLRTQLDKLFQTPEAYLHMQGVPYKLEPADASGPVVELEADAPKPVGLTDARLLIRVVPYFPEALRRDRQEGDVEVHFIVGSDGRVREPQIVKSAGYELDQQLLRALEFWRYEPARLDGRPVAVRSKFDMSFRLFFRPF